MPPHSSFTSVGLVGLVPKASFWEHFVSKTPDAVVRLSPTLEILYANPAAQLLLEECLRVGSSTIADWRACLEDRNMAAFRRALHRVVATGADAEAFPKVQVLGQKRYFHTRLVPELSAQGNVQSVLTISRDVTMFCQSEIALMRKNQELKQVNDHLNHFVQAVSHDLRSPVNSVKGLLELYHLLPEPDERQEIMSRLQDAVQRLDVTLQGLGQLVHVQAGETPAPERVRFERVVWLASQEMAEQIRESQAALHTDFTSAPDLMYIAGYMQIAVRNLLSNALKYRHHQREVLIQLRTRPWKHGVVLSVEDNGIGIDLDRHGSSMFKAFRRFTHQASGSGLGMHLVNTLVEKNGGRIEVESVLGKGTSFHLYLKAYAEPSAPSSQSVS